MMHDENATLDPHSRHATNSDEKSIGGLLSKLGTDISDLVGTEMRMARAEIGNSVDDLKTGAVSLLMSGVVLLAGVMVLLAAACLALAQLTQMAPWVATLIVGAIVTIVGVIMLQAGKKKLSAENLTPSRTQNALQKDKRLVENKLS
ncbi:phage holin family protein [Granulosicoccus sp. 3-233]|uniref:phage holin family protein n=1 Tax=Granulosicoccus sp. 3-233 TaxID=3417969 RepID=UPI003D3317E8